MRPSIVAPTLALLTLFASSVSAIQALPNSPCYLSCGNLAGSGTSGADIECEDAGFATTPGSIFASCVTCQMGSKYVDPVSQQSDLQMALYNLRYAVSWCLFGYPNNTNVASTPCTIGFSCGPLANAFEFDSLAASSPALGYCPIYVTATVHACNNCLRNQNDKTFLNNYAIALEAACEAQPVAGQQALSTYLDGTLFSTTTVNITKPDPALTSGSTGSSKVGLTLGAKIGIVVGALVVFLAITGFCIICNGRRRRRKILAQRQRDSGYLDWRQNHNFEREDLHDGPQMTGTPQDGSSSAGGFFDSPASTRPVVSQRPWPVPQKQDDRIVYEESPLSAVGEKAYFSPYSSTYSSPVSATDQPQGVVGSWPQDRKGSLGAGSSLARTRSTDRVEREPEGDRIEMMNVAPVLLHPGNGRGQPAGLYSEDHRRAAPGGQF